MSKQLIEPHYAEINAKAEYFEEEKREIEKRKNRNFIVYCNENEVLVE